MAWSVRALVRNVPSLISGEISVGHSYREGNVSSLYFRSLFLLFISFFEHIILLIPGTLPKEILANQAVGVWE